MEKREQMLEALLVIVLLRSGVKLHENFGQDMGTLKKNLGSLGVNVSDEALLGEVESIYNKASGEMFRRAREKAENKKKG